MTDFNIFETLNNPETDNTEIIALLASQSMQSSLAAGNISRTAMKNVLAQEAKIAELEEKVERLEKLITILLPEN